VGRKSVMVDRLTDAVLYPSFLSVIDQPRVAYLEQRKGQRTVVLE